MPVTVQFVTTSDGVRIAVSETGAGPPLLLVRGWITHLELMWGEPSFRAFFAALAQRFRVVRFDARGNGLSQRDVDRPDLDDLVTDVEAVADALELESFLLWGSSFGGPIAIAYAARHPERVDRLVLDGTYPTWVDSRSPRQRRAVGDLIRMLESSPSMATTAISYVTDPQPGTRHEDRAKRILASIDPEYLTYLYVLAGAMDVRDDVTALDVPTLVMHARDSQVYPSADARLLAAAIRGARYLELPGEQHNPWEGAASVAVDAVCEFAGVAPVRTRAATRTHISVMMFTDLVSSTEMVDQLGDDVAATLGRTHDAIVGAAVQSHGGDVVKFTGDGALARFSTAAAALAAAQVIVDAASAHNETTGAGPQLHVRVGLNAGEPIEEAGDLHGAAVNMTARVCGEAMGNEVLVTAAVRHLAAGKGFTFSDRGEVRLKGFAEPAHLYRLIGVIGS
jgi:pimeloyl-ACP methyl ester carboxylesterase